jgi:hypothetical protein
VSWESAEPWVQALPFWASVTSGSVALRELLEPSECTERERREGSGWWGGTEVDLAQGTQRGMCPRWAARGGPGITLGMGFGFRAGFIMFPF